MNRKPAGKTPSKSSVKQAQPPKIQAPQGTLAQIWFKYRNGLWPLAGLYLMLAIFFAPVVFQGMGLSQAADMVAAAGMYKMGETAIHHGHFPLWNPTLFAGLPMFASLQYALFAYPPEFFIRAASFIFGTGDWRVWLFHYLMAGIFAYLLARHFGCGRLTAWLAGAAYAFSPQLIVLADVGHGSKLMAMTYLPLLWLLIDRLRQRPSIGRAAALGVAFAVQVLSLHPQVAAYGALLMGLYLLYYGVDAWRVKHLREWGKLVGWFSGSMILALAVSAVLWVSVLDYARYSIRGAADATGGAVAGGGVSWDYATGWSFHPLESITFIQPYFYGFGNETYWGTVGTSDGRPFTQNPMYFGVVVLLLAVLGMTIKPKKEWGFALFLGLFAWVLSFGRYLPILYAPLYHMLPMFNKFRAPVMGQVLLLLPMALLAGVGLEALVKKARDGDSSNLFLKVLTWIAGIMVVRGMLVLIVPGLFESLYAGMASIVRPNADPNVLQAARELAKPDVVRVSFMVAALLGLTLASLRRKLPPTALTILFIVALLVDLWPINLKLANFTPASSNKALFQPDAVVKRLQQDSDKFRIAPLDARYHPANWWSYFGIESVGGYFGAKPAAYQKLMTAAGLDGWDAAMSYPKVLDDLNVRYIVSSYPLDMLFSELQKRGQGTAVRPADQWHLELSPRDPRAGGAFVYRNPGELPRARLIGSYNVIPDLDATIHEMTTGSWDPHNEALLDREPNPRPDPGAGGTATISEYLPEKITISTSAPGPKLLVLADEYYPSGWKVTVDGNAADILRADGVIRAVALPAGDHKVEFVFSPKLFYAGLWTSIISVLLVLGVGVAAVVKKK